MNLTTSIAIALTSIIIMQTTAFADNTNPYANTQPGGMSGGFDMQKMMQAQNEHQQKKKDKETKRKAISKKIADEELAKAKAELGAGSFNDPYALARVRTEKRMAPIYEQWKREDAAERAPMEQKMKQSGQQFQQTGDAMEYGKQQMEMLKQMGIEMPPGR